MTSSEQEIERLKEHIKSLKKNLEELRDYILKHLSEVKK